MDELNASLDLIDQSAKAMRLYIVDDLHLAGIFASLLETYTQRFRERFVSISRLAWTGDSLSKVYQPASLSENGSFPASMSYPKADGAMGTNTAGQSMNEFTMDQDWLAHPFDSSIAPFGVGVTQGFCGFDDELNFIWNADV
jgi:hypothetical protein